MSASSLPSILPLGEVPQAPPLLDATDALERTGGKGAGGSYSEHMFPLEVLAEKYETNINVADPNQSFGLTSQQAKDLLEKYGLNVLTPPPKVP